MEKVDYMYVDFNRELAHPRQLPGRTKLAYRDQGS